jgi:hypothetical protein
LNAMLASEIKLSENIKYSANDHEGKLFRQAQALTAGSRYLEAMNIYATLLTSGLNSVEVQEAASVALLATIADQSIHDDDQSGTRAKAFRLLILQSNIPDAPPILHRAIASRHTSGVAHILTAVSGQLDTSLRQLWEEGCRSKMFLLMLLLLRESLGSWADQGVISKWHLEALASFAHEDMTIPYNVMFDSVNFRRNSDDVREMIEMSPVRTLVEKFGLWQLILFQGMTRSDFLDRQMPELVEIIRLRAERQQIDPSDEGAACSLLLRAKARGQVRNPEQFRRMGERFADFAAEWPIAPFVRPDKPDLNAARAGQRLASKVWQAANVGVRTVGIGAAFLHLGRRARIALCISGQLRGYRSAYASWLRWLLPGAEVETFVHSWRKLGRSGAEPFRAFLPFEGRHFQEIYRKHATRVGLSEMKDRFPTLFTTLTQTGLVDESQLKAFYATDNVVLEDDGDECFTAWSNSRKMHYKIAACYDLAKSDQRGFDLVLRLRPDKLVRTAAFAWPDMIASARGRRVLYADTGLGLHYGDLMIGDQAALAAPDTMALYSAAYRVTEPLMALNVTGFQNGFVGHVTLAATCWHNAISVERMPVRFGPLMEVGPLPVAVIADCIDADAADRMDATDKAFLRALVHDGAIRNISSGCSA